MVDTRAEVATALLVDFSGSTAAKEKRKFNNYSTSGRWIWDGKACSVKFALINLYPTSANYCFIKNTHKISRILPDFICKNNWFSACFYFWADVYSYHIWRAWYNGSYTIWEIRFPPEVRGKKCKMTDMFLYNKLKAQTVTEFQELGPLQNDHRTD